MIQPGYGYLVQDLDLHYRVILCYVEYLGPWYLSTVNIEAIHNGAVC